MLRERGLAVRHPELTVATVDHIVPTDHRAASVRRPHGGADAAASGTQRRRARYPLLRAGPRRSGHRARDRTAAWAHPARHDDRLRRLAHLHAGAFGAIAFGIGTSQVRDVLATQTLAMRKPKLRRITVEGDLGTGVYAKDVILSIIATLGVKGGIGYAYEYGGSTIDANGHGRPHVDLQHEHRGRRPRRLRQPGPHHVRLPARAAGGPGRRRLGAGGGVLARERLGPGHRLRRRGGAEGGGHRAGGHLGHQPRSVRGGHRHDTRPGARARRAARRHGRGARPHAAAPGGAAGGHADRRRLHRLVHEQAG